MATACSHALSLHDFWDVSFYPDRKYSVLPHIPNPGVRHLLKKPEFVLLESWYLETKEQNVAFVSIENEG